MADVVMNGLKADVAKADLDLETADVRAGLLAVKDTGYDNPDLDTVAALLAVGTTAEPAAGERVTVGGRTVTENDTDNRADVSAGTATFAADAGETAVGIFYYVHVTNDADSILLSVHDFTSAPLDGGLTVDPATNWLQHA